MTSSSEGVTRIEQARRAELAGNKGPLVSGEGSVGEAEGSTGVSLIEIAHPVSRSVRNERHVAGESLILDEREQVQAYALSSAEPVAEPKPKAGAGDKIEDQWKIDVDGSNRRRIEKVQVESVMLGTASRMNEHSTGSSLIPFERVPDVAFVTAVEG